MRELILRVDNSVQMDDLEKLAAEELLTMKKLETGFVFQITEAGITRAKEMKVPE